MLFALGIYAVCIAAGALIGYSHGSTAYGLFWPFILGPLGLVLTVVLLKKPTTDVRP